jgi:hypothetical protein
VKVSGCLRWQDDAQILRQPPPVGSEMKLDVLEKRPHPPSAPLVSVPTVSRGLGDRTRISLWHACSERS